MCTTKKFQLYARLWLIKVYIKISRNLGSNFLNSGNNFLDFWQFFSEFLAFKWATFQHFTSTIGTGLTSLKKIHISDWFCLEILLNDKNTTIFSLKYRKSFLILVLGKGMEISYYFKPFLQKYYKKAGWLLLIPFGSLILKVEFGHVFHVMIVKLTWKQLFSFYGKVCAFESFAQLQNQFLH